MAKFNSSKESLGTGGTENLKEIFRRSQKLLR